MMDIDDVIDYKPEEKVQELGRAYDEMAALNGARTTDETNGCRHDMSIDPELFFHTKLMGQINHGVDNIWNEPDFVEDVKRWHPEVMPANRVKSCTVSFAQRSGLAKPRNRYGRIKEIIKVINGELVKVYDAAG